MNKENYRRAMDSERLSDESKDRLAALYISRQRSTSRFSRIRRRQIIKIASLAACFTIVCLAGVPFLFAVTMRAGSDEAYPNDAQEDLCETDVMAPTATSVAEAFADNLSGAMSNSNSYSALYRALYYSSASGEHVTAYSTTTGATAAETSGYTGETESTEFSDITDSPGSTESATDDSDASQHAIQSEDFSASVSASGSEIFVSGKDGVSGTITLGADQKVVALCSYKSCLIACAEDSKPHVTAFIYDVSDVSEPRLLGSFGSSGLLISADQSENVFTLWTEFTPNNVSADDLAAYIPQITENGVADFISPDNCTVAYAADGNYTCYVITELEISGDVSLISIHAAFLARE